MKNQYNLRLNQCNVWSIQFKFSWTRFQSGGAHQDHRVPVPKLNEIAWNPPKFGLDGADFEPLTTSRKIDRLAQQLSNKNNVRQVLKNSIKTSYSPSAANVVAKVLAAILGVELAIMVTIEWILEPLFGRAFPSWFLEFGDPFLLVLILAPIIYHWVALPIRDAQVEIHAMAYHDALTHLPNRRLLNDRIAQAMGVSKRKGCFGAIIALDLDNFKPLNDAHGHSIGDMVLVEVAKRLTTCVRENDTVARFGGDEFVVVLSELSADRMQATVQAERVAEKIRTGLAVEYSLKISKPGRPEIWINHQCTASIGVALFIQKDPDDIDLLKQADAAMYLAKESGRNSVRFFQESSNV